METLYPVFYGTRMVTFDELRAIFEPRMHPEAARRGFAFILSQGGLFGIGGGYRSPGTQPDKPGFATPGKSFHEGQPFPSGRYYCAWDMVCANPGGKHRSPRWSEVPRQGTDDAFVFGWHMNIDTEPWHAQPVELDGWGAWDRSGKPDLQFNYPLPDDEPEPVPEPIPEPEPTPVPPEPEPVPQPTPVPPSEGITVEFTSRNLAEGSVGNDVKFFQRILNEVAGQGLTVDGHYGAKTTQAVKNWQTVFGLSSVDGQMGPRTQRSLIEIALQS